MEVAAAIIVNEENKVLMGKRLDDGKTCSESLEKCVIRECKEELGVEVKIDECYHVDRHLYLEGPIELVFFLVHITQGEVECRVHQALQWLNYDELSSLDHCPGDEALIARLMKERPGYRG